MDSNFLLGSGGKAGIACIFFGIALLSGIVYIIRLIAVRNTVAQCFHSSTSLLLILISVSISYLLVTVFKLLHIGISTNISECILILCLGVISIITSLTVYYYDTRNQMLTIEHTRTGILEQKEKDMIGFNQSLYEVNKNQQILIHDIKNHLISLKSLCSDGNNNEAVNYISSLLSDSSLSLPVRSSDNGMIDSVISRYRTLCSENGISFYSDIRSKLAENMHTEDITSLFSNLLDNALNSALGTEKPFIDIRAERKNGTSFLLINTINSCSSDPLAEISRKYKKNWDIYHGLGFTSIKKISDKYDGNIEMYYDQEDMTFHFIVLLRVLPNSDKS